MIPLRLIPPLLTGSILYYMVGLNPDITHFLKFELILSIFNMTSAALCLMVAVSCGTNVGLANLICVMGLLFSMLFGGFLLNKGIWTDNSCYLFSFRSYSTYYRLVKNHIFLQLFV